MSHNNILADQLEKAIEAKKNDVNSFIWKGAKKYVNKEYVQEEIRLMDASEEQLRQFYTHCKSMLFSTDKENPGRYPLLKIIREQRERCNAELYIRELRNPSDSNTKPYPIHQFIQDLEDWLDKNKDRWPKSKWNEIPIGAAIGVPSDFERIPIATVREACLSILGRFNKKHITLSFLTKMGLWFEKSEIKEYLTKTDENGKLMDKLDVVKENLNITNPNIHLKVNNKGGLSYCEFRAMYNLHNMQYSEMSKIQLMTLRNKVLFKLEDEVRNHALLWEEKMNQIEKVCEARGFNPE